VEDPHPAQAVVDHELTLVEGGGHPGVVRRHRLEEPHLESGFPGDLALLPDEQLVEPGGGREAVGGVVQDRSPFDGGSRRPLELRLAGRLDRGVDVAGAEQRVVADHLGGVGRVADNAGGAVNSHWSTPSRRPFNTLLH
jgi:hypothetical protein